MNVDNNEDDGPPMDPEEQAYYARLAAVVRPDWLRHFEVAHGEEGPSHDPYGWTEFRVRLPDGRRLLYRQGEFSERLVIDDVTIIGSEYKGPPLEKVFEAILGFSTEQLQYWEAGDEERYADIREAELNAGWDPNP